jgi:integrase
MARLTDSRVAAIKPPAAGQEEHPDELVTGLRLRVGAGGKKAWIVRTRAAGKAINKTLGAYPILSLGKAREEAKKLLVEIASNGAPRKSRTFGELVDHWIANVAEPNNRSWKLQKRRLEIHVLPAWKGRKLETIRRADVRELVEAIEGEVAPNRALTLIRTLFRYAMSRDWIDASPAEAIDKPKAETSRDRVLDMDEIRRIYSAAELLGYPYSGFVRAMVLTGQRRTEVAGMRWADLDLEAGTWMMPAEASKSARAHMVPLSALMVATVQAAPRFGSYVWSSDGRSHLQSYAKVKGRLDKFIAADGGEPLAGWVFHDLRRSMATHMVRLGVPELVVGRVLNHAVQGVTGKVYALHSYSAEKRHALDAWAAEIERVLHGEGRGNVVALRG